jgi:PKD repeat protein
VCFDAQATVDNGVIVAASWNFGDGSTGAGLTICHTFTSAGLFNVTLTVQDDDRNCSTITQTILIDTGVSATCSILVTPNNPPLGTAVNLTAVITDDGRVRRFSWNFGDGTSQTTSTNTVSHLYRSAGTFTVLLEIRDDQGNVSNCQATVTVGSTAPTCNFTVSPTSGSIGDSILFDGSSSADSDGDIVDFTWNFGDGSASVSTGTDPIISHSYTLAGTFTVTLNVTDDQGNVTTCSKTVVISSDAPDCAFTIGENPIDIGDFVSLDASASTDSDGTIVDFTWNFGDGSPKISTGTDPSTSHQYNSAGTFTITLTVTDNDGNTSSCDDDIVVGSVPPTCTFTIGQDPIGVGDTASFDASGSADVDGTIVDFTWNFGDGSAKVSTGTDPTTTHQYNTAGTFTITLTVTDNDGNKTSCTDTIVVGANPPPVCVIANPGTNITIPSGTPITFDATGSNDPDGGALTFAWSTPGGTPASGSGIQFISTYNTTVGSPFTASLTVTDDELQSTTCSRIITVNSGVAPTCSASGSPNPAGVGATVNFTGTAADADTPNNQLIFNWNFADGSADATTQNASHTFGTAGNFTVTFTVTDPQGNQCVDEVLMVIFTVPDISISDVTAAEGDAGTTAFNFAVTLSQSTTATVTVNFTTVDGTATVADSDYVADSGTVTFVPGDTIENIAIDVNGDANVEVDETFTVTLVVPVVNGVVLDGTGVGTIQNDD